MSAETSEAIDTLVARYVEAEPGDAAELLATLMRDHVDALILSAVRGKMAVSLRGADTSARNQDALEMAGDARLAVIAALSALRRGEAPPIHNAGGYVTTVTRHACAEFLRRRSPERARLKNRVRYFLRHTPGFAVWTDAGGDSVAGRAEWRNRNPVPADGVDHAPAGETQLPVLIPALLDRAGGPLPLDVVVNVAAELTGLPARDLERPLDAETGPEPGAGGGGPDLAAEFRSTLASVWREVLALPARQRVALLLNLRDEDGGDALALLIHAGTARLEAVAGALDMPVEDLAALLPDLPLDDATIALRLGLTRQQVINLRKTARARLSRRVQAWGNAGADSRVRSRLRSET
ncbi:MAG: hypothetical protein AB7O28_08990 [Vicinamibacterales bacterium]